MRFKSFLLLKCCHFAQKLIRQMQRIFCLKIGVSLRRNSPLGSAAVVVRTLESKNAEQLDLLSVSIEKNQNSVDD